MSFTGQLEQIFVTEEEIPAGYKLPSEVDQNTFLLNGEMVQWDGATQEVYSPVCVRTNEGLKRKLTGTYPVCTQKEAMQAMDAAVAACNNGRGEWPTMSVSDRIECVENFTKRGPDVFPFIERKDSAAGTLSVVDALRSFSIRSLVATKMNDNNKHLLNEIISAADSNFLSTKFIF